MLHLQCLDGLEMGSLTNVFFVRLNDSSFEYLLAKVVAEMVSTSN